MTTENWINLGVLIVNIGVLLLGYLQWKRLKKEMGMVSDINKMNVILPAWCTSRMATDYWRFGLLTIDGRTIVIARILELSADGKWMDVELICEDAAVRQKNPNHVYAVQEHRTKATLQVACIVAAIDFTES